MPDRSQKINDFTETSTSDPQRIQPTDKQMGLGSRNIMDKKSNSSKASQGNLKS